LAKKDTSKYAVPALDKGLDILEYLADQQLPRSQTEIAAGVGRGANEIYRVLVGLEARGYLVREELSGRYRMSLKLFSLTRSLSPIDQLRQVALPHMEDLAVTLGQSCHLSVLYHGKIMVVVQARSQVPVSINISEGSQFPCLTTTSGRVLLANLRHERLEEELHKDKAFMRLAKTKRDETHLQLTKIREQGHHFAQSEFTEGVCDFAALVGHAGGEVNAALAVSTLRSSMSKVVSDEKLQSHVIATAKKITDQLGC